MAIGPTSSSSSSTTSTTRSPAPQALTPNLDRLAKRGVTFTNAQCNAPICGPSRAALVTGYQPHTSGYFGWNQQENRWRNNPVLKDAPTFMHHATAHGYTVFGGGKIFHNGHHDDSAWVGKDGKKRYTVRDSHAPFGTPRAWAKEHRWIRDECTPTNWPAFDSFGPLSDVPDIPADPDRDFPGYRGWANHFNKPMGGSFKYRAPDDRDPMPDERLAQWASQQLKQWGEAQPNLMCLGFNRPHSPWTAPAEYFEPFPLDKIELPPIRECDLDDCAPEFRDHPRRSMWAAGAGIGRYKKLVERGYLHRWVQAYLACVYFADAQLGVVLDALDDTGRADDTLILATSDHGYHMGEKDFVFKNTIWEESCRVPMVMAGPGVAPGSKCTTPVSLVDIFPTVCDYGQMPLPNRPDAPALDGHSLRPLAEQPAAAKWDGPPAALSVVAPPDEPAAALPERRQNQNYTVRSQRYRYVRGHRGGEELYDHTTDPHEWQNLAPNPAHAEALAEHRKMLNELLGFKIAG